MAIYDEGGTCIANDTDKNGNKVVENLSVLPYNQYIKVWTDFGTDANTLCIEHNKAVWGIDLRQAGRTVK